MRRHARAVLSDSYGARIATLTALAAAAAGNPASSSIRLRQAASDLDSSSARYGDARIGAIYSALADLVRIVAMLVDWRQAVLEAETDADRHLRAAIERRKFWIKEHGAIEGVERLAAVANLVGEGLTLDGVEAICGAAGAVPLPLGVFAGDLPDDGMAEDEERPPPAIELAVTFLTFTIDGIPAGEQHFLAPEQVHDLELEVRVSRWPDGAETLVLAPMSVERPGTADFPTFTLQRPRADQAPPYILRQRDRAVILVPHAVPARPFEFKYMPEFRPSTVEKPLAVGHRTLRIESVDIRQAPFSGYEGVDRRILEIRNQLRVAPLIPEADIGSVVMLLSRLGNLASQARQSAWFGGKWAEKQFHPFMRDKLRDDPKIGAELEEHTHVAGGETDLSFRGVRLELKVEPDALLKLADCQQFVEQAASYGAGTGKRVALLCVLETAPKDASPGPVEDSICVLTSQNGVLVPTVLIHGNLTRPSDYSKGVRRRTNGKAR